MVIQDDVMNASQIQTAVVCLLTGTLGRAGAPGNVLLDDGEADLPSRSVVNVSPIYTLHKSLLTDYIGRLAEQRVLQIARGVKQIIEPRRLQ